MLLLKVEMFIIILHWTRVMQHDQYWLKQSTKPCKLHESVVAITNTSCVYLLTCVWMFCYLKVQKLNLSPILPFYYTKATRTREGSVSCPFQMLILRMACSWKLHQRYFLKKMLFSAVTSFDSCIFQNSGIISADISRN